MDQENEKPCSCLNSNNINDKNAKNQKLLIRIAQDNKLLSKTNKTDSKSQSNKYDNSQKSSSEGSTWKKSSESSKYGRFDTNGGSSLDHSSCSNKNK